MSAAAGQTVTRESGYFRLAGGWSGKVSLRNWVRDLNEVGEYTMWNI